MPSCGGRGRGTPCRPRSRPRSLPDSSASGLGGHRCQREARRLPGQRRRGFPSMSAPRNRPRAPGPCGPAPAGDKLASGDSWPLPTDAGPTGRGRWQGRPASPPVRHTPRTHPAVMPRGPRAGAEKPPACSDHAARTHRFLRRPVVHPFKNWTLKKKKVEMIKRPLKIKLAEVPPPRAQETDIFPETAALSALASQCDLIYKNAMSTELSRETCVGGSGASDIGA